MIQEFGCAEPLNRARSETEVGRTDDLEPIKMLEKTSRGRMIPRFRVRAGSHDSGHDHRLQLHSSRHFHRSGGFRDDHGLQRVNAYGFLHGRVTDRLLNRGDAKI